jgi:hypothetical protein
LTRPIPRDIRFLKEHLSAFKAYLLTFMARSGLNVRLQMGRALPYSRFAKKAQDPYLIRLVD